MREVRAGDQVAFLSYDDETRIIGVLESVEGTQALVRWNNDLMAPSLVPLGRLSRQEPPRWVGGAQGLTQREARMRDALLRVLERGDHGPCLEIRNDGFDGRRCCKGEPHRCTCWMEPLFALMFEIDPEAVKKRWGYP